MTSGVYSIQHVDSGRHYVGSSANVPGRWRQHLHQLRRGTHPNAKLQNAWTKYGEAAFEWTVLEAADEADLIVAEQRHIDSLRAVSAGFNISARAGRERAGVKHTLEAIAKMSATRVGRIVTPEQRAKLSIAFKGRAFSDDTRRRISEAKTGKKRPPVTEAARENIKAGAARRPPKSAAHRAALRDSHLRRLGKL